MATSFQISPPESFSFTNPEEWPKWIRRFERYHLASGLSNKSAEVQVYALIYHIGDQADDILTSFGLLDNDKKYNMVKAKFERHFIKRQIKFTSEQSLIKDDSSQVNPSTILSRHCMALSNTVSTVNYTKR